MITGWSEKTGWNEGIQTCWKSGPGGGMELWCKVGFRGLEKTGFSSKCRRSGSCGKTRSFDFAGSWGETRLCLITGWSEKTGCSEEIQTC